MDKKPIGYQPGKSSVLDKKVPKNPKYEYVQSTLVGKTGTTIKDVEILSNNYPMQAIRSSPIGRESISRE